MIPPTASPLSLAADVALLIVYGAVAGFFLFRFARRRRWVSFGVSMMTGGWMLLALFDLGLLRPRSDGLIRWWGVAVGVYLLATAFRAERREPGPK